MDNISKKFIRSVDILKNKLSRFSEVKVSKRNLLKITPVVGLIVFLVVLGILNLDFSTFEPLNTEYKLLEKSYGYTDESDIEEIPPVKSERNPINGVPITEEEKQSLDNRKAFAVTINNHKMARPHSGLSQADAVLEVLTEGGITRYVAIFYGNEPEKIGPVRSVRRYMLDFIAEFDSPVILHEGGASFNDEDEVYVRETDAYADLAQYGYKSMQTAGSRYRDVQRAATNGYVHSLYTSHELISEEFDRMANSYLWESQSNIETLEWERDAKVEDRGDFHRVDFTFLETFSDTYASSFIYNIEKNSYDRILAGESHIDELTGEQISPKNVVVEWHNYRLALDGYARIIIDMLGQDEAVILKNGKLINATWRKDSRTDRTRYYDSAGEEINLVQGQIWKVILVKSGNQKYSTVEYKYENYEAN